VKNNAMGILFRTPNINNFGLGMIVWKMIIEKMNKKLKVKNII
jgi:hypothetical protein